MISTGAMLRMLQSALNRPGYIRHGWTIHEWDISGSCISPRTREIMSRPDRYRNRATSYGPGPRGQQAYSLILHTKCRKCSACLRIKQRAWTARAVAETRQSERSWFGTMTFAPSTLHRLRSQARFRLANGGTDYDALSLAEQFDELMREVNVELTLFLKRVRAESGATLRYLSVCETHQSGEPHLHMLLHEDTDVPVREKTLSKQWAACGFTKWRLVRDAKAAFYVCKYISKSALGRVRASVRYGLDKHARKGLAEQRERERSAQREKTPPKTTEAGDNEQSVCIFGLTYRSRGAGEYGWYLPQEHPGNAANSDFQQFEQQSGCIGASAYEAFNVLAQERKPVQVYAEQYRVPEAYNSFVCALDSHGL